jgi:hypothetical protein
MKPWRCLLVACTFFACDDDSISGLDQDMGLAGHYQGTAEWTREGAHISALASITLRESLNGLTGEFLTNRGQRGTVSGSVNGMTMTFQIDQSEPCAGEFSGAGSFSPVGNGRIRLTGTYSGDASCMGAIQGAFDLVRYPDGGFLDL